MDAVWHSARNTFSYPRKNYKANLGIIRATLTANEQKNFDNVTHIQNPTKKKLGGDTTFGKVEELSDKYVMKTMAFSASRNDSDNLKIFLNEVKVGGTPGIEKVGPKIYAWRIFRNAKGGATFGQYIMDSFTGGDPNLESAQLHEYSQRAFKNSCPTPSHPLVKMLKETITNFWRITKGYHGDLHTGNIAVVYNKDTLKPKRVIVFDYGSHKRFKEHVNNNTCFEDFVSIINRQWKNTVKKKKYVGLVEKYPNWSRVNVLYPNRSQPRRPNTQLLSEMTVRGSTYNPTLKKMIGMTNNTTQTMMKLFKPYTQTTLNKFVKINRNPSRFVFKKPSSAKKTTQTSIRAYFKPSGKQLFRKKLKKVRVKEPSASNSNILRAVKSMTPRNFKKVSLNNSTRMLNYVRNRRMPHLFGAA
jgi:hypothetical protein